MKKINFKQPKYILPLVILLPLTYLAYSITGFIGGNETKTAVATDSLNLVFPDADSTEMKDKLAGMDDRYASDDGYSAVNGFGEEDGDGKDSLGNDYTEGEMDAIDSHNAELKRQHDAERAMEESLANSRRHINGYDNSGGGSYRSRSYGGGSSSFGGGYADRSNDLDDYAKELERIQRRSQEAQRAIDRNLGIGDSDSYYADNDDDYGGYGSGRTSRRNSRNGRTGRQERSKKTEEKAAIVKKVKDKNADKFNTVSQKKDIDAPLIKAMIDKTTKAHEGTRLRFKLLDDVTINNITLKKGTYIYGLVTGFGQQRVKAEITSILHGNKFIKVHLSVYDNDGMEGFYVPESAFRDMMKEAGAQAMQQNMQFDNGYGGSELNGENVALQALQNIYQSGTQAVAANIRKNKAKIKYNTIVYLINTSSND